MISMGSRNGQQQLARIRQFAADFGLEQDSRIPGSVLIRKDDGKSVWVRLYESDPVDFVKKVFKEAYKVGVDDGAETVRSEIKTTVKAFATVLQVDLTALLDGRD